ncbi:MAG: cytochrome c family protein [Chitinispirillaceae bacterium]|nr:cytochrome c family protein [Chitinispirillaceae bacterium]
MNNHKKFFIAIIFFSFSILLAGEPRYIGSHVCARMCHKGEKKGSQYEIWQKSGHAKAFQRLSSDQSKEIAKKMGITVPPTEAPQCLKCHVTAYGVDKKLVDTTCKYDEGVGCEACHGPGSEYRKLENMKNHQKAVAAGLIEQNESVCVKCHNKESPTYKPFNYTEDVKKIAHPAPKKK